MSNLNVNTGPQPILVVGFENKEINKEGTNFTRLDNATATQKAALQKLGYIVEIKTSEGTTIHVPTKEARSWLRAQGHDVANEASADSVQQMINQLVEKKKQDPPPTVPSTKSRPSLSSPLPSPNAGRTLPTPPSTSSATGSSPEAQIPSPNAGRALPTPPSTSSAAASSSPEAQKAEKDVIFVMNEIKNTEQIFLSQLQEGQRRLDLIASQDKKGKFPTVKYMQTIYPLLIKSSNWLQGEVNKILSNTNLTAAQKTQQMHKLFLNDTFASYVKVLGFCAKNSKALQTELSKLDQKTKENLLNSAPDNFKAFANDSIFINPVQRAPRFELLQRDLQNKESPISVDKEIGTQAYGKIKDLLSEVNISSARAKPDAAVKYTPSFEIAVYGKDKSLLNSGADYIVNPANKDLRPGGGLAGKIYDALGKDGQKIRKEKVQEFKSDRPDGLKVGETLLIPTAEGTKLQASGTKGVINVPGPDTRPGKGTPEEIANKEKLIVASYINSIQAAIEDSEGKESVRIGFPAISAGIFEYDPKEYMSAVLNAMEKFAKDRGNTAPKVYVEFYPFDNYNAFLNGVQDKIIENARK